TSSAASLQAAPSKMTKMKKKFTRGEATTFISRKQALKRLQLSLNDFRRLCILKGVYPQEPVNRRRVNKGSSTPKVYYHLKDIQFLGHERVMQKLRDIKAHLKKAKRAKERGEMHTVDRLQRNFPAYTLDHIIRERYPAFEDAVRDLDDCLCLCFLFSRLPKERGVPVEQIRLSARLTVQFLHWVIAARALRKVFVSIKGYYFEADVNGVSVVWSVPHQLGLHDPADVDFKILRTFNDFYTTMLGFVNYRLYSSLGLAYPPALANEVDPSDYCQTGEAHEEFMASLNQPLLSRRGGEAEGNPAEPDDFPDEEAEGAEAASAARRKARAQQRLFNGCRFFLNRETPRQILCFVIRSCGGEVSWSPLSGPGSRYPESDQRVTHQIVDRPLGDSRLSGRAYVQPQWVFDCVNSGSLLPTGDFAPGLPPPPHLSPFAAYSADDADGGDEAAQLPYSATRSAPPDPVELRRPSAAAELEEEDDYEAEDAAKRETAAADAAQVGKQQKNQKKPSVVAEGTQRRTQDAKQAAAEERRLREMMLPKKHKQLYKKMVFSRKRQARESAQLAEKKQKRQRTA
ncbi:hypothetical protein BOX15_Mlig024606g3, partial [Macrostomum lignano]